jgi:tRNA1Val (adenine37-N6)-methyltransferase
MAKKLERKIIEAKNILDIGTGTGLLSLMIAQKSSGEIDAVEIEENSYFQAKENIAQSPWNKRIHAYNADIKSWSPEKKYDLIICNPPFFENDLRSAHQKKNIAKHHDTLTLNELIEVIKNNLNSNGHFAVLLPFHRVGYFKTFTLENNFYLADELLVKQTPRHSCFRGILLLGTEETSFGSTEITIKNEEGNYTEAFNYLLKDYYL